MNTQTVLWQILFSKYFYELTMGFYVHKIKILELVYTLVWIL